MNFAFAGVSGGIQTAMSGNTSLIFTDETTTLLVDVSGSPAGTLAAFGIKPECLNAVILTHNHIDHLYGLPSLVHNLWLMGRQKPLMVFGGEATIDSARRLCNLFSLEGKPGIFPLEWRTMTHDSELKIGTFSVRPVAARHGVPTFGFIIASEGEKIVYSADSAPLGRWPIEAASASVLVHEAGGTVLQEHSLNIAGHSSSRQAAEVASLIAAIAPEKPKPVLMLCHLPPEAFLIEEMRHEAEELYTGEVLIPRPMQLYDTEILKLTCSKAWRIE